MICATVCEVDRHFDNLGPRGKRMCSRVPQLPNRPHPRWRGHAVVPGQRVFLRAGPDRNPVQVSGQSLCATRSVAPAPAVTAATAAGSKDRVARPDILSGGRASWWRGSASGWARSRTRTSSRRASATVTAVVAGVCVVLVATIAYARMRALRHAYTPETLTAAV